MSNFTMINPIKQQSSIRPTNGRQTVGDGAFSSDMTPSVLAVCHMQGTDSMYYYSTTGAFDAPPAKCPPDRGSSNWVTDSLAPSIFPSSYPASDTSSTLSSSSFGRDNFPDSIVYPPTPPPEICVDAEQPFPISLSPPNTVSAPRAIIRSNHAAEIPTPPLTPDDGASEGEGSVAAISAKQSNAALDFLSALFPRNGLGALQFAKSVSISSPNLGAIFEGVVLELPGKPKTFYVDGKSAAHVNLRESIVALLDLADEQIGCSALVLALERKDPALGDLLHSLMYVGGSVVTKPPFPVDPTYVLVGLEI
ncbi:ornithine decarboxylase antizyme-domain-containing protein [Cristinia sonorae]|uniref:Ornithine decarboxylase antizyme n=1 Tax=Cristinia sonorae TaxID=1940300 RepID=A0A8K0V1J1_9AGAR|nr:ornithine decarboxylase antizyme-domain-containing protein [Cristinia sonorae]